jgi:hypothetical protein
MNKLLHTLKISERVITPNKAFYIFAFASIFPLLVISERVLRGSFALWYDPARDLLMGLDNLLKLTLIGPTSGIPGMFYGPYWIWWISFAELFSKDPRIITIIVALLPYIILFPVILMRFSNIFKPITIGVLWLLFLTGFLEYMTKLWNPYPAPLLILLVIYLLCSVDQKNYWKDILRLTAAGFFAGLVVNFHLSFGIGMLLGLYIFLFAESVLIMIQSDKKNTILLKQLVQLLVFTAGFFVAFLPFIAFEIRHQFIQTRTLLNALMHYGGVVNLKGLSHTDIIRAFFQRGADILQLPLFLYVFLILVASGIYIYNFKKEASKKKKSDLRLLLLLLSLTGGILFIYLSVKNPIWEYHFIGVEILWLLFIGVLINRSYILRIAAVLFIIYFLIHAVFIFTNEMNVNPKTIAGNMVAEKVIVDKVHSESKNQNYTVYAYSPSIYTYEYSYLFKWLYNKDMPYDPGQIKPDSKLVYLIIPKSTKSIFDDFINFRTPGKLYKTASVWQMQDGTSIIKRIRAK